MTQIINITCPGCGERLSLEMKKCPSCHGPVMVTSFHNLSDSTPLNLNKYANSCSKALESNPESNELNMSLALCYLKLKLYDKALIFFDKALEDNFENSEIYYYASLCLLKGKKAFLTPRISIDKILEYINVALMIEPRGIYYYFLAYIKYDYFSRKSYTITPNFREDLNSAITLGVSDVDITQMFEIIGTERPSNF